MASRCQLNRPLFDHGDAVLRVVVPVAAPEESLVTGPRQAHAPRPAAGLRVLDVALRCLHITRAPGRSADVERERPVADVHVARAGGLTGTGPEIQHEA